MSFAALRLDILCGKADTQSTALFMSAERLRDVIFFAFLEIDKTAGVLT